MATAGELEKKYKVTIVNWPPTGLKNNQQCPEYCICGHHISKHYGIGTAGQCRECGYFPTSVHNFQPLSTKATLTVSRPPQSGSITFGSYNFFQPKARSQPPPLLSPQPESVDNTGETDDLRTVSELEKLVGLMVDRKLSALVGSGVTSINPKSGFKDLIKHVGDIPVGDISKLDPVVMGDIEWTKDTPGASPVTRTRIDWSELKPIIEYLHSNQKDLASKITHLEEKLAAHSKLDLICFIIATLSAFLAGWSLAQWLFK